MMRKHGSMSLDYSSPAVRPIPQSRIARGSMTLAVDPFTPDTTHRALSPLTAGQSRRSVLAEKDPNNGLVSYKNKPYERIRSSNQNTSHRSSLASSTESSRGIRRVSSFSVFRDPTPNTLSVETPNGRSSFSQYSIADTEQNDHLNVVSEEEEEDYVDDDASDKRYRRQHKVAEAPIGFNGQLGSDDLFDNRNNVLKHASNAHIAAERAILDEFNDKVQELSDTYAVIEITGNHEEWDAALKTFREAVLAAHNALIEQRQIKRNWFMGRGWWLNLPFAFASHHYARLVGNAASFRTKMKLLDELLLSTGNPYDPRSKVKQAIEEREDMQWLRGPKALYGIDGKLDRRRNKKTVRRC